ncbi:ycf2 domain protein, putative [Medicago truncatula]|uniref:Ycf2 domain protein, putative n=1 Tax=Medicago truncatula TaxID=3880 RepID=G7KDF8_MEDTR|nr:ycf2 domain protein, putative [Medicago truncatula]
MGMSSSLNKFQSRYFYDLEGFVNEVNFKDESKKKSLLVLPPLFYEENDSFYPNNTYGYIK